MKSTPHILLIFSGLLLVGLISCQENPEKVVEEKYETGKPKRVRFYDQDSTAVKEIVYYKNGNKKIKGKLLNGNRHGTWISYLKDGSKWTQAKYKQGKLVNFTSCKENLEKVVEEKYETGQPKLVRFYDQDNSAIKEIVYYKNGNKKNQRHTSE